MAWDIDGPPMHTPAGRRYAREHYHWWPLPWENQGAKMASKKDKATTVGIDTDPWQALVVAQAQLIEMGRRAAAAEAETQLLRNTPASQHLAERPQQVSPPRKWCVESAQGEKRLAVLLNTLAQAGWMVDQIFEPRGGAYGVVAWREGQEHAEQKTGE